MKKIKPETEIRRLKLDLEKTREMAMGFGIPAFAVYLPDITFKKGGFKRLTPRQKRWIKKWLIEKTKEYNEGIKKHK